jgi:hypothetical protein
VYDQAQALSGKAGLRGIVVFSAERLTKEGEALGDPDAMARADSGDLPSFFVDRKSAAKGMTCTKFTKSAAYNLGVMLTEDPIFGALRRRFSATPIHHDPIPIGGCQGYHYKGEGKNGSWILDVRAVSDGKTRRRWKRFGSRAASSGAWRARREDGRGDRAREKR